MENTDLQTEARSIAQAIATYAEAYKGLQNWQDTSKLIPRGDQKTGSIGEFYATLYLKAKFPDATLTNGHHSEKGWDIDVKRTSGTSWRVQVKAVSAFNEKRQMSPIHQGWHELFVLYLGEDFRPLGFWVIEHNAIESKRPIWKGCKCPKPGVPSTGSPDMPFGENRVEELISHIGKFIEV